MHFKSKNIYSLFIHNHLKKKKKKKKRKIFNTYLLYFIKNF